MTKEEVDKAYEEGTWLVHYTIRLVKVISRHNGHWWEVGRTTSAGRRHWVLKEDLRVATAKDFIDFA